MAKDLNSKDIINSNSLFKKFFKNREDITNFVFKTKETRNYLSHHAKKDDILTFNDSEMIQAIRKLDLFIKILLLNDIGFEIEKNRKMGYQSSNIQKFNIKIEV